MPDILIRGLDSRTLRRLKDRAKRHGRSLQNEAKIVIENAAGLSLEEAVESARQIRVKLGRRFDDSAKLIREDRRR
jgi:plasmid stability protein